MLKACGVIGPCSPRGPVYSGKLRARAVELYSQGVRPGYIGWAELQNNLEKEFPGEFPQVGEGLPSPETVLEWVRRWPDAPQRLRDLRVQQADSGSRQFPATTNDGGYQLRPVVPVSPPGLANTELSTLLPQLVAVMFFTLMVHFTLTLSRD